MRAVVLDYEQRTLSDRDIEEPSLSEDQHVLFRVQETGVCGTDRELSNFVFGEPPKGDSYMVLGHEAIGQVVENGSAVRGLKKGDWVAPVIRRACIPACVSCSRGR